MAFSPRPKNRIDSFLISAVRPSCSLSLTVLRWYSADVMGAKELLVARVGDECCVVLGVVNQAFDPPQQTNNSSAKDE